MSETISGQLSTRERELLTRVLTQGPRLPERVVEVGTWLGGGSTLHILRALHQNGHGHLWGIEFDRSKFDPMIENIARAIPEAKERFTPLFGRSEEVLPKWLRELPPDATVDFAFLDGGDNPNEQILEFEVLEPRMPVGAQLMAHDARTRKGKWLVPVVSLLDNWQSEVLDLSEAGLLHARKIQPAASPDSKAAAQAALRRLKREPGEWVARVLPSSVRDLLARLLPTRLIRAFLNRR